jgi:hypothetical protein
MSFLTDILQQYVGAPATGDQATDHFSQVADAVPSAALQSGLAAAFGSDRTPPLGDMVGQLFGQSNAQQQAGVLNQILASAGPALLATLAGGALGRFLNPAGGAAAPAQATQITPEQASQLSPDQVKEIVEHAQRHDPGITDRLSAFYAQHTGLVKTLGGAALAIALAKVADHMRS